MTPAARYSLTQIAATVPVLMGFRPPRGSVVMLAVEGVTGRHHGSSVHVDIEGALRDAPRLAADLSGPAQLIDPAVLVMAVRDDRFGLGALRDARRLQSAMERGGARPYHPSVLVVDGGWQAAREHAGDGDLADDLARPVREHDLAGQCGSFPYLRAVHALGQPHDAAADLVASYRPCPGPLRDELAIALPLPQPWGPSAYPGWRSPAEVRFDSAHRAWQRLADPLPLTGGEAAPILLSLADPEVAATLQGWLSADYLPAELRPVLPEGSPVVHDHLRALALMAPPDLLPGPSAVLATAELARGGGTFRAAAALGAGTPDSATWGRLPRSADLADLALCAGRFTNRPLPGGVPGPFPDPLAGGAYPADLYWACLPPGSDPGPPPNDEPPEDPLLGGPGGRGPALPPGPLL